MQNVNIMNNDFLLKKRTDFLSWLVCITAALFFFYEFIQMNMLNAISAQLMQTFSLKATELGKLSAYYFYANLLFLLPAGLILDRYSTRKIILISLFICFVSTFLFATTSNIQLLKLFRFLSGIGSAFCFLSSIRLASRWFPSNKMALVAGVIVTMAMTGGMVAQAPLTFLTHLYGWRHAVMLNAGFGLFVFALIYFIVRDYPEDYQQYHRQEQQQLQQAGFWHSMVTSYLKPQNWLCGIYTSLMNLPFATLGSLWGILYLKQVLHIPSSTAANIISFLFIGTILGSPLAGWLSDKIGKRKLPMFVGTATALIIICGIIYLPFHSVTFLGFLFFLLGLFTATQIISYPTVAESNPSTLTATSVSVVSFLAIGGYAIFQPLFGWLMDLHWNGLIVNKQPIYTASDFHVALLILPISFIVAFVAAMLLRETNCQSL